MRSLQKITIGVSLLVLGTVKLVHGANRLYLCDHSGIYRVELDGSGLLPVLLGSPDCVDSYLDVDVSAGKLYWSYGCTTPFVTRVARMDLDGSNFEPMATQDVEFTYTGVALDRWNRRVYWARDNEVESDGRIERSSIDSIRVEEIVSGAGATLGGVEVDPMAQMVYWTAYEFGGVGTGVIKRTDIDVVNVEVLVTGLNEPRDIALDLNARKIYWTDSGTRKVQRANLVDGENVEDLVAGLIRPLGIDLDLGSGKVYWNDLGAGKVQRANLDGTNVEDVVSGLEGPIGLRVVNDDPTAIADVRCSTFEVRPLRTRVGAPVTFLVQLPRVARITLDLYTVRGTHLIRIFDDYLTQGTHLVPWNDRVSDGRATPNGVYFYRSGMPGLSISGKVLVLR